MKQFFVYFKDNTNTDPTAHTYVERMVVEAEDEHSARTSFLEECNYECSVRDVEEVSYEQTN